MIAAASLCAACAAVRPDQIYVQSARPMSEDELNQALPPGFMENEGLQGKVLGIAIRLDGQSVRALTANSRNPIVKYVDCTTGRDLGYSFGPFLERQYLTQRVRREKIDRSRTYTIVATATKRVAALQSVCATLEARLPIGLVAKSKPVPVTARNSAD